MENHFVLQLMTVLKSKAAKDYPSYLDSDGIRYMPPVARLINEVEKGIWELCCL